MERDYGNVLILGVKVEGLKETCHIIRVRLSNREKRLRCCGKIVMSQNGMWKSSGSWSEE